MTARRLLAIALLTATSCVPSVSYSYLQPWFRIDTTTREKPIAHERPAR